MNIGLIILLLFTLCLLVTTVGFKKYVYFLSIGYGFSVFICGLAMLIIFGLESKLTLTTVLACILFMFYGFRLSFFLLIRELKNKSYRKTLENVAKTEKPIPLFVMITMWISVAVLYICQVSGVMFTLNNNTPNEFLNIKIIEIISIVIMVIALLIETIADAQKSKYKKTEPHKPAMKGLYRICRCPNYYGEILFWTGTLMFSVTSLFDWWQWLMVLFGYICIVYVMLNGAKRLENRQEKSYADLEEFRIYSKKTPIIIYLFIPIHSLKNSKVIK